MSEVKIDLVLQAKDRGATAKLSQLNKELKDLKRNGNAAATATRGATSGSRSAAAPVAVASMAGAKGQSAVRNAAAIGTRMSAAGSAMTQTGTAVARVAMPMALGLGMAAKQAAIFDQRVRQIQSKTTGSSLEDIQKVGEEARRIAKLKSTNASSSEILDGGIFLAQAGFSPEKQIAALETITKLSSASGASMAAAGNIATNIMSGFGISAGGVKEAGDILARATVTANVDLEQLGESMSYVAPVAKSMKVELGDAAAMIGILGNAGIHGSRSGRALRSSYLRLADPPKKAKDAIKKLGVTVRDQNGDFRDMSDILADVQDATKDMGTKDKAGFVNRIFGKNSAATMLSLMANLEDLEAMKKTLGEAHGDGALDEMASIASEGDAFKFKQMKRDMIELAVDVGPPVVELLQDIAKEVKPVIANMAKWAQDHPEFAKGVGKITLALIALTPVLMAGGAAMSAGGAVLTAMGASSGLAAAGVLGLVAPYLLLGAAAISAAVGLKKVLEYQGIMESAQEDAEYKVFGLGVTRDREEMDKFNREGGTAEELQIEKLRSQKLLMKKRVDAGHQSSWWGGTRSTARSRQAEEELQGTNRSLYRRTGNADDLDGDVIGMVMTKISEGRRKSAGDAKNSVIRLKLESEGFKIAQAEFERDHFEVETEVGAQ